MDSETGVAVARLPTWFGTLSYSLRGDAAGDLHLKLGGDRALPPGKIVIKAPSDKPLRQVIVNGKPAAGFSSDEAVVSELLAEVVLRY